MVGNTSKKGGRAVHRGKACLSQKPPISRGGIAIRAFVIGKNTEVPLAGRERKMFWDPHGRGVRPMMLGKE